MLDLFCGAGGAAKGYHDAGFEEIVGVDIEPQKHYPYTFIQADALEYLEAYGHLYDAFHASPPCQGYSIMTNNLPWHRDKEYPLLIGPTIELLEEIGKPYILENVMGARKGSATLVRRKVEDHGLEAGWLCGTMFGLPFYRHRLFAANWLWLAPAHQPHSLRRHPRFERFPYGGDKKGLPSGVAGLDVRSEENGRGMRDGARQGETWEALGDGTFINSQGKRRPRDNRFSLPNMESGIDLKLLQEEREKGGHPNPVNTEWRKHHDGHVKGWKLAAEVMRIDWMNRAEVTQAIPPVFTEHLGRQFLILAQGEAG